MFTILADAMFAATLARRGSKIPENLKDYADRHTPSHERKHTASKSTYNPYRNLW